MSATVRCPVCHQHVEIKSALVIKLRKIPRHKVTIPGTNAKTPCTGGGRTY